VPQIGKRLDEAAKLGFKKAVVPRHNLKGLRRPDNFHVCGVDKVEEALEEVLH